MTEISDAPPVQPPTPSPEAIAMAQAGAHPVSIDAEALLAQIKAMQSRLNALEAERGVPADPIKGGIANLIAHLEARAAQYPYLDFSEIQNAVKELPDVLTRDHSELIHHLVSEFASKLRGYEVDYLPELSGALHTAVLKKAVAA